MFKKALCLPAPARRPRWVLRPAAWAAAACLAASPLVVRAQASAAPDSAPGAAPGAAAANAADPVFLQWDKTWSALPSGASAPPLPAVLRAQRIDVTPGQAVSAEGEVEFRKAGSVLKADRISYRYADDTLRAQGHVQVSRDGAVYSGPELQVRVDGFTGWFDSPRFEFPALGSSGFAERVEFLGDNRMLGIKAHYSSCPREGTAEPAWELSARRIEIDLNANEGRAEGASLRFLGVTILAAPAFSFPVNDERKSGWLPPSVDLDNRSGVDVSVPYYLNLAPNRDATITPRILSRRGVGADLEFRYLEPGLEGLLGLDALPNDRVADRSRYALRAQHRMDWGANAGWLSGAELNWTAIRVSDDDWWKDFPRRTSSLTPRLLAQNASFERPLEWGFATGRAYGRLAHWQVLQSADAILSPYQRSPQLGLRLGSALAGGLETNVESEFNRFTLARKEATDLARPEGSRWHFSGRLAQAWRGPGWWVQPAFNLHGVVYNTEGRSQASMLVPTISFDAGAVFERQTQFLGRSLRQVLEPRLHFVRTPYRNQSILPNYDAAGKDFNITSIYSDNAWSGVDRISDSHQVTLGATTRLVRDSDGAEVLRLGLAQRVLLSPENVTPDDARPSEIAAEPLTRKLSDVLLLGSTQVVPRWTLTGTARFNADTQRAVRSVLSARYNAGDFRTLSAAYRFTRGQSEQVDFGWQWPLAGAAAAKRLPGSCGGRLYSVGRFNYSMLDSRITDSLLGFEYDAGCWIGRIVAERVSTGRSEATTRLMLQLELVGLSRLGSNPLKVLKENIPGYRLLRDERGDAPSMSTRYD